MIIVSLDLLPQCSHAAEDVVAAEVVGVKFDDSRCDYIQKFLNTDILRCCCLGINLSFHKVQSFLFGFNHKKAARLVVAQH